MNEKRYYSFDVLKSILIFGVILIHISPFYYRWDGSEANVIPMLINKLCGLAVPIFFLISGFLFEDALKKRSLWQQYWRYVGRLLIVFLGWSLIWHIIYSHSTYYATYLEFGLLRTVYWQILEMLSDPVKFVFMGTSGYLWFLSALIISISITACFERFKSIKLLIMIALLIYVFSPYINLHIRQLAPEMAYKFNPMIGPFKSLIYVALGFYISRNVSKMVDFFKIFIVLGGVLYLTNIKLFYSQGSLGSLMLAVGVFLLSVKYHEFGKGTIIEKLSKYTLGIYCAHFAVMLALGRFEKYFSDVGWDFIFPVIVYFVSLAVIFVMQRIRFIRQLVV